MFVMFCTRLDISDAVSVVSTYMDRLDNLHQKAIKWILRYLRGTSNICLEFGRSSEGLVGYVDSDYVGDLDQMRSLAGYLFAFENYAISWKATL